MTALMLISKAFASMAELALVSISVSNHPKVVEKANEITLKGISVDQILAEDGLKINLSTKSKISIKDNIATGSINQSDDLDREFLDGVITFNKNLYDFGVVAFKTDAEVLRKEALKLEYYQSFSTILSKLLNTVNDVTRIEKSLLGLREDISIANKSIDEIKLRFTSGIGTIMDVRQAQLSLLDLQTESQTLEKEKTAKATILRNEFNLQGNDFNAVSQIILQFNQQLNDNQQSIKFVIDQSIQYQRSTQIINYEKSALRSQIKSLKSENMPQLSASITGVVYDLTRDASEYEVYGGVNLTMPLFDSDLSQVKQRGLTYRVKVQNDIMRALDQDKLLALNKLTKKYQSLQIEKLSTRKKVVNLTEKLSQIMQRSAVADEGLLTKFQTQLQLGKAQRDLLSYPYFEQSMSIDYWTLNEQLMEKINIRPIKLTCLNKNTYS